MLGDVRISMVDSTFRETDPSTAVILIGKPACYPLTGIRQTVISYLVDWSAQLMVRGSRYGLAPCQENIRLTAPARGRLILIRRCNRL